jgi:hypothetical protein
MPRRQDDEAERRGSHICKVTFSTSVQLLDYDSFNSWQLNISILNHSSL